MRLMYSHQLLVCVVFVALPIRFTNAQITSFTDLTQWESATGAFTTIDFNGITPGTAITDQFADLGINFTDGDDLVTFIPFDFPNDGFGLRGSPSPFAQRTITVAFDFPRTSIGADYPGSIGFQLFLNGEEIGHELINGSGAGNFFGIVSTVAFDSVRIFHPSSFDTEVALDDLHFGSAVPTPGALSVLALGALIPGRWRRRHEKW